MEPPPRKTNPSIAKMHFKSQHKSFYKHIYYSFLIVQNNQSEDILRYLNTASIAGFPSSFFGAANMIPTLTSDPSFM